MCEKAYVADKGQIYTMEKRWKGKMIEEAIIRYDGQQWNFCD